MLREFVCFVVLSLLSYWLSIYFEKGFLVAIWLSGVCAFFCLFIHSIYLFVKWSDNRRGIRR